MSCPLNLPAVAGRRTLLGAVLSGLVAVLGVAAPSAPAQGVSYPTIELIVPFPAGGTNDVLARIVADGITAELGQKVIIMNKPGASAAVGSSYVARSSADGHVLLLGSQGSHSANPYLFRTLPYDPLK